MEQISGMDASFLQAKTGTAPMPIGRQPQHPQHNLDQVIDRAVRIFHIKDRHQGIDAMKNPAAIDAFLEYVANTQDYAVPGQERRRQT